MKDEQRKEIRFADFFGGIGGFRLGIERAVNQSQEQPHSQSRANRSKGNMSDNSKCIRKNHKTGFKCVFYCEIDKYAVQVYNKRFNENWQPTDITKVSTNTIPDFDLLCAGFPCQAFSIAGKRKGFKDTRGTLFFEIARVIRAKGPSYLFLENVKGLLNHEKGQTFRIIFQTLSELGYDFQWMVLNSKFFGVPQNRERVFIIGNLRENSRPEILSFREDAKEVSGIFEGEATIIRQRPRYKRGKRMLKNYEYDLCPTVGTNVAQGDQKNMVYDRKGFDSRKKGFRQNGGESPALTQKMGTGGNNVPMIVAQRQRDRHNKNEERIQQFEPQKEDVSNSITSFDKDNYVYSGTITQAFGKSGCSKEEMRMWEKNQQTKGQLRRLTPVECERLQGFPDNWTAGCSDTQRYKQMGNAVTVNVIKAISEKLLNL